jgi:Flp pilus assembly pilin Flp
MIAGVDMFEFLRRFKMNEDGAVTVDWVVLTAAVVGLAAVAVVSLSGETEGLTDRTSGYMERQDPLNNLNIQDVINQSGEENT